MMSGVSDNVDWMASKHLVYGLVDPRTLMVRYVGKSATGMKRPKMHGREAGHNQHKDRWIAKLRVEGLDFEIAILQESLPESLSNDERWWISYGRASGWPLTNMTDGGAGGATFSGRTHSAEARAKIGAAHLGMKANEETRAKLSVAHKGERHSDEHCANKGRALKGRVPSAQCLAAAKLACVGRRKSEAEMLKLQEIGRRQSNLEHLARVSTNNVGRKHSAETIAKMKIAWGRRRARSKGGSV